MQTQAELEPTGVVPLAPVLDLNAAAPLMAELVARRGQHLVLDGSAVVRLGAQCLQVLLAAETCWGREGFGFAVTAPSAEFADGLALMGCPHLAAPAGT